MYVQRMGQNDDQVNYNVAGGPRTVGGDRRLTGRETET